MDALADRDRKSIDEAARIAGLRADAALELHRVSARFASEVNRLLTKSQLVVDPPTFDPAGFDAERTSLFQINVNGRIVQMTFEAPEQLTSTEHYRQPYILEGAVRSFNQELLEHESVEEELLFFCAGGGQDGWWFFDARTYRTGRFDEDYLLSLMERLV